MLFTIGMVAVALGIIGIIWGIFNHIKAGRVSDAPFVKTGEAAKGAAVASPKGAISVEGTVACPQPLMAPVSGVPCHWFHVRSLVRWKDGETEKTEQLDEQKVGSRFTVDDGSGPVWVDPSQGGDFEPTQKKAQKQNATFMAGVKGEDIVFGSYKVNPGLNVGLGRTYEVEEEFMPLQTRLYVCGVVG
jgi:hypothetical protein